MKALEYEMPFFVRKPLFSVRSVLVLAATCGLLLSFGAPNAQAQQKYHPEHPVVKEMVDKAVNYLNNSALRQYGENTGEGVVILAAYAVFKVTNDPNHPVVVRGVEMARHVASTIPNMMNRGEHKILYVVSLAGMLLPSVDVDAHGEATKVIRDFLLSAQKKHGGYGYMVGVGGNLLEAGDISQTQYVMLALWTMHQMGIEVPDEPVARSLQFLMAAQTAEGNWPYQFGGDSPGGYSNSLAAAGLSGLLLAGDMLGSFRSKEAETQEEDGIIPAAFRRVYTDAKKPRLNFDRAQLDNAWKRGEEWHRTHAYSRATWHYYYVYSMERYESFLDFAKGKRDKSPPWYNQGVEELRNAQSSSGGWGTKEGDSDNALSPDVCTSFAILFLIRSTQKAIGELNEAINPGGYGLPDDVSSIANVQGRILSPTATNSIDDALKMLEGDGNSEGEDSLAMDRMLLATDPKQRKEQLNRFSRLLRSRDYKARKIASKMIGRGDDLDYVPDLIYALSDPDPEVPRFAEQSLRLLSRQLDTFLISKEGPVTDQMRSKAVVFWKKWFQDLRPDYVFID